MTAWHDLFSDDDHQRLLSSAGHDPGLCAQQADGLWRMLGLKRVARVLDAPCGAGRLSIPLAERGPRVLGVDKSARMVAAADDRRAGLSEERLRFVLHDLRLPLSETGFDVALNAHSSLGYGDESEDEAILRTLHGALRPGGRLVVETLHRDAIVAAQARGAKNAARLSDGTLVIEDATFDPLEGGLTTAYHWSGPSGAGTKEGRIRLYSITELSTLVMRCGFGVPTLFAGCSAAPFCARGPDMGGSVALLCPRLG